jgi:hypothetical protein
MAGIKNIALVGYGAKITGPYGQMGFYGIWQDRQHSVRTMAVTAGDTSVTINPSATTQPINGCQYGAGDPIAACLTIFSVGQTVALMGGDLQFGSGFPQNPYFFQYLKITAIDSNPASGTYGKITFAETITDSYPTTWPSYNIQPGCIPNNCFDGVPDYGGPVTLFAMEPSWDASVEIRGLNLTSTSADIHGAEIGFAGRDVVVRDVTCDSGGQACPYATQGKNSTWYNVSAPLAQMESDKMVENLTLNNVTYGAIQYQSSSIKNVVHNNVTGVVNGCGLHCTVNDSHLYNLWPAATSFGATKSYHITNSQIDAIEFNGGGGGRVMAGLDYRGEGLNNLPDAWSVDASGTIATANAWIVANRQNIQGWNLPGELACWTGDPGLTCAEAWKVTDITQDGGTGVAITSMSPSDGSAATTVTFPSPHGRSAGDMVTFLVDTHPIEFGQASISNGSGCGNVGSGAGTQLVVTSVNDPIVIGQDLYRWPVSAAWSSGSTYNSGDFATDAGSNWMSLIDGNLNNQPSTTIQWQRSDFAIRYGSVITSQLGGCGTPNGVGTYTIDVPQFQAAGTNIQFGNSFPQPLVPGAGTLDMASITNSAVTGQPAIFTWSAQHGKFPRDKVVFYPNPRTPSAVLPAPLVFGQIYYVESLIPGAPTQLRLTDTLVGLTLGSPISTTTNGSGSWETKEGVYYVLASGLTSTQFQFSNTQGGTAVRLTTPGIGAKTAALGNTYTFTTSKITSAGTWPSWTGLTKLGIFELAAPDFSCNGCTGHPFTAGLNGLPAAPIYSQQRLTFTAADTANTVQFYPLFGNLVSIRVTVNTPYGGGAGTGLTLYQAGFNWGDTATFTSSPYGLFSYTPGIVDWASASPAQRLLDTTSGGYPHTWSGTQASDSLATLTKEVWSVGSLEYVLTNISASGFPMSITVHAIADLGVVP